MRSMSTSQKSRICCALIFALTFWLLACEGSPAGETASLSESVVASLPRDGGTVIRRLDSDISTVNPIVATSGNDRLVANYLFTPLIYLDRDLRPTPGLAKSWRVSNGGRLYRFELIDRATFMDGVPVRASDVVFTLRKIADPTSEAIQTRGAFEFIDLSRTRAIDQHTVEVAFREPLATQLTSFADVFVLPEHIYSNGNFRNDFNRRAVGSGPYLLVRRDEGKGLTLKRRADYWATRPHIETVVFKVIADENTAWQALMSGELDETLITSDRWTRERDTPAVKAAIDLRTIYTPNYNAIAWNNRNELIADRQIRRAMAMCIPVDSLVEHVYQGTARGLTGPFTPDDGAYNPAVPAVPYRPQEAKKILADQGWIDHDGNGVLDKGGKSFSLGFIVMAGSASSQRVAQTLQGEWRKIGIDIELVLLDGATAIQRIVAGNYDVAYVGWSLDSDPDPYALFHSASTPPHGQNVVLYSSKEADRLIEEGRRELDRDKRRALYQRFHEIVAIDQPYAWVVQPAAKWAINKRVRGVEISPRMGFFSWFPGELGWWLATDPVRRRT